MSSLPIRCVSCGKVISNLWNQYKIQVDDIPEDNEDKTYEIKKILNNLGVGRMCCMRMFMTHVDIDHIQMLYPTYPDNVQRIGISVKKPKPKNYVFKTSNQIIDDDSEL